MTKDGKNPFDKAYKLSSAEDTQKLYSDWSDTYDSQLGDTGYITPRRCAEALALYSPDTSAPMLDIGCGTGLSGTALAAMGFTAIDGTDPSSEMIAVAQPKQLYQKLWLTDLSNPFDFKAGIYAAMAAVGVINPGHAPGSTIRHVMDMLPIGGLFVFSLNDNALKDSEIATALEDVCALSWVSVLHDEYGDHLPGIKLNARIYVLQRTA